MSLLEPADVKTSKDLKEIVMYLFIIIILHVIIFFTIFYLG